MMEEFKPTDTIINIEDSCNQNCIFCSRGRNFHKSTDEEITRLILSQDNTISLEGGEPTLRKDILKWIKLAINNSARDVIVVTNGIMLAYKDYAKKLIDSGVTLFNINFPSHLETLSDAITRTPGSFRKRCKGIENLLSLGAGGKTRLTFVVNSVNYRTLPDYVKFVKQEFPGIFYIEFNLIKVLGYVETRKRLVPRLTDIKPYLASAWGYSRAGNIKFLVDGIPLCFMEGFEDKSIDVYKLVTSNYTFLSEKVKCRKCRRCSLSGICAGPRADYVKAYDDKELKASRKNADTIVKRIMLE